MTADRCTGYTRRAPRSGASADVPATWLFPADSEESSFRTVCARIDRFNRDATQSQRSEAVAVDTAATLIPDLAARPRADRLLAGAFAHADALARRYQRLTHAVLRTIIGLTVALALTFEIYAEIMPRRELPALYLVIFAAIAALFLWHRRFDAQGRYLDYRALAEALRVQFYWRLGGLGDSAAASYLRKQLDELRWIRDALRGTNTLPPPTQPRMDLVLAALGPRAGAVLPQPRRHAVAAHPSHRTHVGAVPGRRTDRHHHACSCCGTALRYGAPGATGWSSSWVSRRSLRRCGRSTASVSACAARRTSTPASPRSSRGRRKPSRGWRLHPRRPQRDQNERALLRELGRESLMENGDWVLSLRERPIALPKG